MQINFKENPRDGFTFISSIFLTALLSTKGKILHILIGILFSVLVSYYWIYKVKILKNIPRISKKLHKAILGIFTIVSISVYSKIYFLRYVKAVEDYPQILKYIPEYLNPIRIIFIFSVFLGLGSIYIVSIFWEYILYSIAINTKEFYRSIKKYELTYLILSVAVLWCLIIFTFYKTNLFYIPEDEFGIKMKDVLFTTDTTHMSKEDIFMSISGGENDFRQILFGLFASPFGTAGHLLALPMYYIKNSYILLISLLQAVILPLSAILLARLMKLGTAIEKKFFYVFISVSYTFVFWSLPVEQYIISYLFLVLFIYDSLNGRKNSRILFLGASGTLITSSILFPLLLKKYSFKEIVKEMRIYLFGFLSLTVLVGQTSIILYTLDSMRIYTRYMGTNLSFYAKFIQFSNFVKGMFISPKTMIFLTGNPEYSTIQLYPEGAINLLGVSILLFLVLGIFINYRDKFMNICHIWIVYSFLILCIIGWGTSENGLILYSLYFFWAYICGVYMTLKGIFVNKNIFYSIIAALSMVIFSLNFMGIKNLIEFGILFYGK